MSAAVALLVIAFTCLLFGWASAAIWLAFVAGCVLFVWSVRMVSELLFKPFPPRR